MRLLAPAAVLFALASSAPAAADPDTDAPHPAFIDHTMWAQWQGRSSLRVFPTPAGRMATRQPGAAAFGDEAWTEVLNLTPDADTPGMRSQFICHWELAELAQPGKSSWNLEPWRPVVDDAEMVAAGCNPGGPEERF